MSETILILGGGSWGTALAGLLAGNGHRVALWEYDPAQRDALRRDRENKKYLPGSKLPETVTVIDDPLALASPAGAVLAAPSQAIRATARAFAPALKTAGWVVCAAKGLEEKTFKRLSEVIGEELGGAVPVGALSGPSHAEEVVLGIPTSVVAAFADGGIAKRVQEIFSNSRFRVYTNSDLAGVELGGALKNIIAIATGIGDGLGLGDNTRAALITRGLAEITRMGVALGARRETFMGLAGLGDLVVTCTSRHSRNRRLGELIGRGATLAAAQTELTMVAEGVPTCAAAHALARARGLTMPITAEVHRCLFEGGSPRAAVTNLMTRALGEETV